MCIRDSSHYPRVFYWETFLNELKVFVRKRYNAHATYKEQGFAYTPLVLSKNKTIRLNGYFQSYKYFEESKGKIYDFLHITEKKDKVSNGFPEEFFDNTISMHFRIGDYKGSRVQQLQTIDFYMEALNKLIQDTISGASNEFKKLHEDTENTRVKYATKMSEDAKLLQKFVMETLAKEVSELKSDRAAQKENFKGLEELALRKLTNELSELHEDHKKLVEARVKLISEGRIAIEEARSQFIKKASEKVNSLVVESFKSELSSLKTYIRAAKENNFGRKIMESFAA